MKRSALKRSDKPMAHGGLPSANKVELATWDSLRGMGCAVCLFVLRIEDTPAEIHHILDGQRRISHAHVIPLCAIHHRQGTEQHPSRHSVNGCHGGLDVFERKYGPEMEIAIRCAEWTGDHYMLGELTNDSQDQLADDPNFEEAPPQGDDRCTDTDANDQSDDGDARTQVERLQAFNTPVHISVTHYRARLCDPDNLNAKGVIDAIVEAGLLQEDSQSFVKSVRHDQVKVKSYDQEKTRITIEEVMS